jgi:hypothetical protein
MLNWTQYNCAELDTTFSFLFTDIHRNRQTYFFLFLFLYFISNTSDLFLSSVHYQLNTSHCCPSIQTKPYLYISENCQAEDVGPTNGFLYQIWEYNLPGASQVSLKTAGRVWVIYCYLIDNDQRNSEYPSVYRPGLQAHHSCNVSTVFKGPVLRLWLKRLFYYSLVRERALVSEATRSSLAVR